MRNERSDRDRRKLIEYRDFLAKTMKTGIREREARTALYCLGGYSRDALVRSLARAVLFATGTRTMEGRPLVIHRTGYDPKRTTKKIYGHKLKGRPYWITEDGRRRPSILDYSRGLRK